MDRYNLAIVSSLYHAEAHYAQFVPAVIKALRQLANERLACKHLLIFNDPTDEDRAIVDEIQRALADSEFIAIHPLYVPREGLYASWNRGVREAESQAITFWNADDLRDGQALAEGSRRIHSEADLVYFDWIWEERNKNTKAVSVRSADVPGYDPFLFSREMHCGPFFMFARKLFDKTGPFDAQFKIAGDLEWCIRAFHVSQRVEKAETCGGIFRNFCAGLSTREIDKVVHEEKWIRLRHCQQERLPIWEPLRADDFRMDELKESDNPETWAQIQKSLCAPIIPSERAIDHYYNRGRLRYRVWTRVLWKFFPRYNLRKLQLRLLKEGISV